MIANQFNSASGEIHVNLHSQDHDFGIFQQVFGRKMAEIDNYSKPQKQVRNVGWMTMATRYEVIAAAFFSATLSFKMKWQGVR
jgi:hypothetical protein